MSKATKLTLAFIDKRPESAARVLTSLQVDDAAAFTSLIPTRYAVRLLARSNAKTAALIVKLSDVTAATAILRDMEFSAAAAILRQIPADDREALLSDLPRRQRRNFERSLAFAPGTVGAGMSTSIDVLSENNDVAEALRLKKGNPDSRSDLVFIVDDKRALTGVVSLLSLLQHPKRTVLKEIVDTSCTTVSPQMRLSQTANLNIWYKFSQLPVVSRRGELLGAIFRQSVLSAESTYSDTLGPAVQSITGATLQMMGHGALALAALLIPSRSERNTLGESNAS